MGILGDRLQFLRRLGARARRGRLDDELRDEIAQHIAMRERQLIDDGLDPREAAYEARRMFGNPLAVREQARDLWTFGLLDSLAQDVGYCLRLMRRSKLFTGVAVASLGIAIAATTVVIGVVNAALWRWSAMYEDPARLVYVWQTRGGERLTPTPADFRDWRRMAKSFSSVEAYTYATVSLSGGTEPEQLRAAAVTPHTFATLGVRPILGAGFIGDEETWGRHTRVLLGEMLWRRRFGGDPAVVGRTLTLDGTPYEIAGVMPAGAWFSASKPEIFVPFAFAPGNPVNNRNSHFIWVIARLRDGTTIADASAEMGLIARQLEAQYPANKGLGAAAGAMSEQVLGEPSQTLAVVASAVGLLLLIACVNVAGLLLVRTGARERELAVRASLGATPLRVARQLVTEGVTLALVGGIAGVALAVLAAPLVPAFLPADIPRVAETGVPIDWRVLLLSACAIGACGVLIGVLPALGGRRKTSAPLRGSSRTSTGSRRQAQFRSALVAAEIALALMLVTGASLIVRSFANLQNADLGVRSAELLTVRVPLAADRARRDNAAVTSAYLDRIADAARAVPGVLDAAITSHLPLGGGGQNKHFFVVGQPLPASYEEVATVSVRQEGPRALAVLGATLVSGRFFGEDDRLGSPPVAIVNRTLARRFFGSADPIGQVICLQAPEHLSPPDNVEAAGGTFVRWTIVGVVDDVRYTHPAAAMESVVHVPYRQRTRQALMTWAPDYLVLRTTRDANVLPALRERLRDVAPDQPLAEVRTMDMIAAETFASTRVLAWLLALFSSLAVFLSCVGIYGTVASAVGARTQEIGIRVALGGRPGSMIWLLLRNTALLAALGVAGGIGGALAGGALIQSQLHGVRPNDAMTFALAPLCVLVTTAVAAWIPARRAVRIDPAAVLRGA